MLEHAWQSVGMSNDTLAHCRRVDDVCEEVPPSPHGLRSSVEGVCNFSTFQL